MEMNDILNGLNSCDDSGCESMSNNNCCCEGPGIGGPSFGGNCGFGGFNGCGCGLNSWIWILLILFYCGCGRSGLTGGYGGNNNACCCERKHDDCCGCGGNYGGGLLNSGLLNNCTAYLFLLVILFLCNGFGRNVGGCGGFGNIGGLNCCGNSILVVRILNF